jgi:D-3-phosphoglycerate dehydrogenase
MKCLIIDDMHLSILALLPAYGMEADYRPDIKPREVEEIISGYEGLLVRSKMKITRDFLDKATKLRFIARAGAGVDQIDESYLMERQIVLFNAPEGNRDAVGEHTLGMLLCLLNKIQLGNQEVRKKLWLREENRGIELGGKTVGIIGYGHMGKAFAQRLRGFGCEILAFDIRDVRPNDDAKMVDMDTIWVKSDVVSYHIPLNSQNWGLVNEAYLDRFQKPVFLVNMARGEIIPFKVVRYGLEKGILRGAALDVLENEKLDTLTPEQDLDFTWLCKQPNVLLTPHVGGWTFESYEKINVTLVEKIARHYGLQRTA